MVQVGEGSCRYLSRWSSRWVFRPHGPANVLFFTAGPNDESEGLFGSITTP